MTLATLGVVLSATVTATGMHYLANWEWIDALVFGALIAATDPVAVISTFKEAKAQGRLLVLIEAESLLNDGTAAVGFGVVIALASGQHFTSIEVVGMLLKTVVGGCCVRRWCGPWLPFCLPGERLITLSRLRSQRSLRSVRFSSQTTLECPVSWATITAGLVMGNFKSINAISERGRGSRPGILGNTLRSSPIRWSSF